MKTLLVLFAVLALIGGGCLVMLTMDSDPMGGDDGHALAGDIEGQPSVSASPTRRMRRGSGEGPSHQSEIWKAARQEQVRHE